MPLQAKFKGTQFKDRLFGMRISACWVPRVGFNGNFFVYLWQRMEGETAFGASASLGENAPVSGKLEITDQPDLSYSLDKINFESSLVGVTRGTKYRQFEFRYSEAQNDQKLDVTLTNSSKRSLKQTALGEKYKYSLDSDQQLLGFRARLGASQANVFRFTSLSTASNSFLKKMIDLNNQWIDNQSPAKFTIKFGQGDLDVVLGINDEASNVSCIYFEESWGAFLGYPPPDSLDLLSNVGADREHNTRFRLREYTPLELLDINKDTKSDKIDLSTEGVQTTSVVFEPGHYQNYMIT